LEFETVLSHADNEVADISGEFEQDDEETDKGVEVE